MPRGAGENDTYGPPTVGGGGREMEVTDNSQVAAGKTLVTLVAKIK
jgi:hypothetical protein